MCQQQQLQLRPLSFSETQSFLFRLETLARKKRNTLCLIIREPVIVDEGHKHNIKKEIHCRRELKDRKKICAARKKGLWFKNTPLLLPGFFLRLSLPAPPCERYVRYVTVAWVCESFSKFLSWVFVFSVLHKKVWDSQEKGCELLGSRWWRATQQTATG